MVKWKLTAFFWVANASEPDATIAMGLGALFANIWKVSGHSEGTHFPELHFPNSPSWSSLLKRVVAQP